MLEGGVGRLRSR